jgi:hypothetical protein
MRRFFQALEGTTGVFEGELHQLQVTRWARACCGRSLRRCDCRYRIAWSEKRSGERTKRRMAELLSG